MRTRAAFMLALGLAVAYTATVLVHVQNNRRSERAPMQLTDRELSLDIGSDVNSGATVWLSWSESPRRPWVSRAQLAALGFDMSISPDAPQAPSAYTRQMPRRCYVVFALADTGSRSRLIPIDVGLNPSRLMAKYPNGSTHLITAALVGLHGGSGFSDAGYVDAQVASIDPRGIHVPAGVVDRLRAAAQRRQPFGITIRYGADLEPRIVDGR